ncbi:MAG: hypothetical protein GVX90_04720 [Alphaproteobacteria bacterium]|jgi:hypothetical protein|nr:hypothetical protein [Alphaproteobacteria bacterium]
MGRHENLANAERRLARRRHINRHALLKATDGAEYRGAIRNISETGCLFRCDGGERLTPGRYYSLRIEGLELQVVCAAWSDDGLAGLELVDRLREDVVEELVRSALLALAANARADRKQRREPLADLPPLSRGRRGSLP